MATRILAASDEAILPGENEVLHPLSAHFRVYLPKIGDGSGQTVVAGTQILFATSSDGTLEILRNSGHRLRFMSGRTACVVLAETFGQWSCQDAPSSYPYARVTDAPVGGGGPHTHTIDDIEDLQDALDGKAASAHTHIIGDTTGLQTALDGKAASSHTHNADDINAGTLAAARLPVSTTAARGAPKVDHNSAGDPVALTQAGHESAADPHPQYALDSEKGAAAGIATLDSGSKLTASQLPLGTSATTACAGNDARLTDSRTPTPHAASHAAGGSDAVKLDDLATPDDNTDLNASTTRHGLLRKLSNVATEFLNGQGNWATPAGGGGSGAGLTRIAGSSGAAGADLTWMALSSNSSDITSTTQTVVMTITGLGAGTWRLRGSLIYQTAATTTGIGITVNHTGTVTRFVSNWMHVTTGGAAATGISDQVTATAAGQLVEGKAERVKDTRSSFTVGVDSANADELAVLDAVLVVSVSGDLQIKIATEVAASAVRLMAGSTLELYKIA